MMVDSARLKATIKVALDDNKKYVQENPLCNFETEHARMGALEWVLRKIEFLENEARKQIPTTTNKNLLFALRGELRDMILLINKNIDESEDDSE